MTSEGHSDTEVSDLLVDCDLWSCAIVNGNRANLHGSRKLLTSDQRQGRERSALPEYLPKKYGDLDTLEGRPPIEEPSRDVQDFARLVGHSVATRALSIN